MKKLILLFIIVLVGLVTCSCTTPTESDNDGDKDQEDVEKYIYNTPETDKLKLTEDYENKDFINDGIGVCTVSKYIDGDTTIFKSKSGEAFTLRYSGINTPESTYRVEPWGFVASKYTKNALKNADKIVLQCESMEERKDNNGRYLGWVWLINEQGDSRLLNLELVEVALAQSKANDTVFDTYFSAAVVPVTTAGCRIYGQKDSDFDYSKTYTEMSIKELRTTYGTEESILSEKDKGKKIRVSGVVTRLNGVASCYIQQYDERTNEYYGVYVFGGYNPNTKFQIGNSVIIDGTIGYYSGCLQISGASSAKVKVKSFANQADVEKEINILDVDAEDVLSNNPLLIGQIVRINNLTIKSGYSSSQEGKNAFTIICSASVGSTSKRIDIRVDNNISLFLENGERIDSYEKFMEYYNGYSINSLVAIVSYYDNDTDDGELDGYIQLMLTRMTDIDLVK